MVTPAISAAVTSPCGLRKKLPTKENPSLPRRGFSAFPARFYKGLSVENYMIRTVFSTTDAAAEQRMVGSVQLFVTNLVNGVTWHAPIQEGIDILDF